MISNKIYPFIQSLYPNNHQIISENDNLVNYEQLDINELHLHFSCNDNKDVSSSTINLIGCSWKSFNSQYGHKKDIPIVDILKSLRDSPCQFVNLQYGEIEKEKEELDKHDIHLQEVNDVPFYENIIHHASVIRATGIVITSSNIVAHIAGILHKKTILIHPHQFNNHPYWEKAYDNFSHLKIGMNLKIY